MAPSEDPIAIIGTSCRVAGANNPAELWSSLLKGEDLQSSTDVRFSGYYDRDQGKNKGMTNVQHAYLMKNSLEAFDNGVFGIAPVEAAAIDPQQRMLLEVCWEAFESAGIALEKLRGSDTAVYAGLFVNDYGTSLLRDIDATPKYHSTGTANSIAANRVSYFFDLRGPSMVIDTACSSTITALHMASNALRAGDAQQAVVCGANIILNPDMFVTMSELGFLSPRGRCHSFDASGDGYARGEGVMAIVLKPLSQAIADNDPIRAIIRGSRLNQDGRTNGITLPSGEAQEDNIRKLYSSIGVDPSEVDYLEAHGTGTKVGDPIELGAIERVFTTVPRREKLIVGSIKCHVGHLEACAALIGIIKTIECLNRGAIPAQLHIKELNPKINFKDLHIPQELLQWPQKNQIPRLAGVNSFGFGGANGHVVLEQYIRPQTTAPLNASRPHLVRLSAETDSALAQSRADLAVYLVDQKSPLGDVSYMSLLRRSLLQKSQYFVASTLEDLVLQLQAGPGEAAPPVISSSGGDGLRSFAFVFTGQGAQWAQMGSMLVDVCPAFTETIDQCDAILASLPEAPSWSIRDELVLPPSHSHITSSRYSQPLCTALQLGLLAFCRSIGLQPKATVGHSSGEIAAAHAAGILSLRDAIIIAYYRGVFMSAASANKPGAMAAITMTADECTEMLKTYNGRVDLACINSPSSCTISGDAECIDEIVARFKEEGIFCRKLRVDTAFHSHHMLPLSIPYRDALDNAAVAPATPAPENAVVMYSSVYGRAIDPTEVTSDYWARNMTQTVRFREAIGTLAQKEAGINAILEVGPHPALKGPALESISETVGGASAPAYFGTLNRGTDDIVTLFSLVGSMISARIPLTLEKCRTLGVSNTTNQVLMDYPLYPWDHDTIHWAESRVSRAHRFRQHCRDMLLGARVSHDTPLSMCWRNILRAKEVDWLNQRRAHGESILVPSLLCQMVIRAARQLESDCSVVAPTVKLTSLKFHTADIKDFDGDADIETQLLVAPLSSMDHYSFRLLVNNMAAATQWAVAFEGLFSLLSTNSSHSNGDTPLPQPTESLSDGSWEDRLDCPDAVVLHSAGPDHTVGQIKSNFDFHSCESESLQVFDWIFSLTYLQPGIASAGAEYTLATVDEILIAPTNLDGAVEFENRVVTLAAGRALTSLTVIASGIPTMSITGATSIVAHDGQTELPYHSLFLAPVWLPDISAMQPHDDAQMDLQQLIAQVTHKWPSCDIAIATKRLELQSLILSKLPGIQSHQRPRFRSVSTTCAQHMFASERVKHDETLSSRTYTLLFVDSNDLDTSYTQKLVEDGLICVLGDAGAQEIALDDTVDRLCSLSVDASIPAWLLRRKPSENSGTPETPQPLLVAAERESVNISNVIALKEAAEKHVVGESVDLVVFDSSKQSILCTMDATSWINSLQILLADAKQLLWIAIDDGDYPYWGAASAFVRCVMAEQPSLKAATVMLKGPITEDSFRSVIVPLLVNKRTSVRETELRLKNGQLQVLRYLPDDTLNALTGDGPTCREYLPLDSRNHRVSHAKPGQMIIRPIRHVPLPDAGRSDLLEIQVHSSVLDMVDLRETFTQGVVTTDPGHFFFGTAVANGQQYIGFHHGCHSRRALVSREQVYEVPSSVNPKQLLFSFAGNAMSYAAMMFASRARSDDTVRVSFHNNLTSSFKRMAQSFNCHIAEDESSSVDFDYAYSPQLGFTLNGKLLDMESALRKSAKSFDRIFQDSIKDHYTPVEYKLSDLNKALSHSARTGDAIVLDHQSNIAVLQEFSHTNAPTVFRSDVFYVFIGGFGGLGVCLIEWMFSKGARHFAVLSRRGPSSQAAKEIVHRMTERGGSLLSIEADAGDKVAVSAAISKLRIVRPIGGCLNMALILDDSPFINMSTSQWNIGVRHKIDTTNALHEATLEDDLEFFIMFSSVAAIVGNRGQAASASGNAYLNAMAEYRKSLNLPGVAIAPAAIKDIGVLADDPKTRHTLERSGLSLLETKNLLDIVEAAVHESRHQQRNVLATGLSMFSRSGSAAEIETAEGQVFWRDFPEFSHLFGHPATQATIDSSASLVQEITAMDECDAQALLCSHFIQFLSQLLGYPSDKLDPSRGIAAYGADSLIAVSCRFWFHQRIDLNVTIFEILGARSIDVMIAKFVERMHANTKASTPVQIIEPSKHSSGELTHRPLSQSQNRLWFLHNFLLDKTMYNLLLICYIEGQVNEAAFRQAWGNAQYAA